MKVNIRKMQINPTMSYHLTPTRMTNMQMKLEYIMLSKNKPVTNDHIQYDLILLKIQNRKVFTDWGGEEQVRE